MAPEDPLILNDYAWFLGNPEIQTGNDNEDENVTSADLERARDMAQRSVDMERKVAYLDTLAWIHYFLEAYDEARALLEEATGMEDRDTGWQVAQYHLGRICEKQEDRECADSAYREVVEYAETRPLTSAGDLVRAAREYSDRN